MNASSSTPRNSIDGVRPQMVKADLDRQSLSIAMTTVVKDALIRHYGSLKAAAISLRMDQGQLSRELDSGDFKFKRLDGDSDAKAFIACALHEAYGRVDPKARALRLIREGRRLLDELAEVVA
jgi:hypothetical protein